MYVYVCHIVVKSLHVFSHLSENVFFCETLKNMFWHETQNAVWAFFFMQLFATRDFTRKYVAVVACACDFARFLSPLTK